MPRRREAVSFVRRYFLVLIALLGIVINLVIGLANTASPSPYKELQPFVSQAASRHNTLKSVSDAQFEEWMMAILVTETTGPAYRVFGYSLWQTIKLTTARLGRNTALGVAQIRPETAAQLMQGWIDHDGRRIYHGVKVAYPVYGSGPYGVSPALLARPEISIEYLAATLEMGIAVARSFGYEPTLEDLARWQNTGIGPWNLSSPNLDSQLWEKGSAYVARVKERATLQSQGSVNLAVAQ